MTRINTNVGSLVGRNNLQRANASLSQSLTRLSTGLRINTGADDPAGLIASENLRSDITSIERAIGNTDRANQVIATADSALGQVSSLLNDIRGLVTESANAGALSEEQISANQLQVDSSLEALNRIAQTTTFQGRRLLDGSLDFLTSPGANSTNLSNLQIDQANLGANGQTSVDVNVSAAATQATVEVGNLPDVTPTANASVDFSVETTAAVAATGQATFEPITQDATQGTATVAINSLATGAISFAGQNINITASGTGAFTGTTGNAAITTIAIDVDSNASAGGTGVTVTRAGTAVTLAFEADEITVDDVVAALNGVDGATANVGTITQAGANALADGDFVASTTGSGAAAITADVGATALSSALAGGASNTLTLTAVADSNADGAQISAATGNPTVTITNTAAADSATFDEGSNTLTINLSSTDTSNRTLQEIDDLIDASGSFTATGGNTNLVGTSGADFDALTPANLTVTADGVDAVNNAADVIFDITATAASGANGNIAIAFAEAALGTGGGDPVTSVIGNADDGYTVLINNESAGAITLGDVRTAILSISEVDTVALNGGSAGTLATQIEQFNAFGVDELGSANVTLTGGVSQEFSTATFDLTTATGVTGNFDLSFTESDLGGAGTTSITVGAESGGVTPITVAVNNAATVTLEEIRSDLEALSQFGTVTLSGTGVTGATTFDAGGADNVPSGTTNVIGAGSASSAFGIDADLVFELAGSTGAEVLNFEAGTSLQLLIDGVNAVSDATGVTAAANGTSDGIVFTSSEYGSDAVVDINVIEEGAGGDFVTNLTTGGTANSARVTGTDVQASVNGITATGDGNDISINTATLDLSATVENGFTGTIEFDITGGGALFQLGPDVVSNQQARLGISSVNTAALGGTSGLLFQLGTGGDADLTTDATTAAAIVEEAINEVTSLRGRLGAFQRTTLETNKNALNDTLANLTEAESSIRDADFAAETAELTRSQILVQSGTRVLAIANQNPQNVLALLG